MTRAAAASVLTAVALSSCGGGADAASDPEAIRVTLTTYLNAVSRGDGKVACDQLGDDARRDLIRSVRGARDCGDAVTRYRSGLTSEQREQLRTARVDQVRVDGDRATAKVLGGAEAGRLERRGDRWLIAGR